MAARSVLACISLIAFAVASQPAFAANDDTPAATPSGANPSAAPAKRQHHRHHGGKRRNQQQQQQQTGSSAPNG